MSRECCFLGAGCCDDVLWCTDRYCTARQEHVCGECGGTIRSGQRMNLIRQMSLDPRRFMIFKTCEPCARMRDQYSCGDGCYLGVMRTELMEHLGMDYVTGEWCESTRVDDPINQETIRRYNKFGPEAV